jgi:HAD superfamily hydrolase (TIGR01484 family)
VRNVSSSLADSLAGANKLLASDLDGTLIPPHGVDGDGGIAELERALGACAEVAVAYVTGRSLTLAVSGVAAHRLPPPAVLVCDVGTSIFVLREGMYVPDAEYRGLMMEALEGGDAAGARAALAGLAGLEPQEDERQTDLKLSYYAPADAHGAEVAARAREILADLGAFSVVYSVDPVAGRGLLDILPAGVAKDVAVRYLHDRIGVHEDAIVYAGDSGNDEAAMLAGFRAVVVGNATDSLKERVRRRAVELGVDERLHFAEASYAAGVLEGCRRFGFL